MGKWGSGGGDEVRIAVRVEVESAFGERDQVARAEHLQVVQRECLQRDRRVRRRHHRAQQQEDRQVVRPAQHTLVLHAANTVQWTLNTSHQRCEAIAY